MHVIFNGCKICGKRISTISIGCDISTNLKTAFADACRNDSCIDYNKPQRLTIHFNYHEVGLDIYPTHPLHNIIVSHVDEFISGRTIDLKKYREIRNKYNILR